MIMIIIIIIIIVIIILLLSLLLLFLSLSLLLSLFLLLLLYYIIIIIIIIIIIVIIIIIMFVAPTYQSLEHGAPRQQPCREQPRPGARPDPRHLLLRPQRRAEGDGKARDTRGHHRRPGVGYGSKIDEHRPAIHKHRPV